MYAFAILIKATLESRSERYTCCCTGKRKLKDLLLQKDNRTCADCGAADPKWA